MNKDHIIVEQYLPRLKKPPLNKVEAEKVLKTCAMVLEALQCNWWLSAGTMLGACRERDFITGDYDIDVEMTGDTEAALNVMDSLAPRYRDMWHKDTGRRLQAMWLFPENTLFDLYIYYPDKGGLVSYTPYSDQEIIYPPDLKRTTINFKGWDFPCWDPERYLKYVYGEGWRTPGGAKSVYGNC